MVSMELNGREIRNSKEPSPHPPPAAVRICLILYTVLQSAIKMARSSASNGDEGNIEITRDLIEKFASNRDHYKAEIKRIDGLSDRARTRDAGWIAS
jgi:hypothetical protein